MRDLYAPLGLTPRASEEEIRAALARTDHRALRSAAVLLDPERKRIYRPRLAGLADHRGSARGHAAA